MKDKLNSIQQALDQLLEKKREAFPRFYFLSNDELLEMLANSKIEEVQKNLKKCFDGISRLRCEETKVITHMISPEKEEIEFNNKQLKHTGDLETWLKEC